MIKQLITTRFAPSPSGQLHLGNARTALFNWLYARHFGGRFLLRIEDTDAQRSKPEFTAQLIKDLKWLGLSWDAGPDLEDAAGPYQQSRRGDQYCAALEQLSNAGHVYPCYCSAFEIDVSRRAQIASGKPPRYAGTCRHLDMAGRAARVAEGRVPTLRFRVPETGAINFTDLVHGEQKFACSDIGDFIVQRADGSAAFFFSNLLDDAMMGINTALRGEDHLSNTPRQILLAEALSLPAPTYGHLSLITGDDGAPLSKRHGAQSLGDLRDLGYLPEAINNHLFRLGHSSDLQGLHTLDNLAEAFDVKHLGRSPARFDTAQLNVWQKDAVHRLSPEAALQWLGRYLPNTLSQDQARDFVAVIKQNIVLPNEVVDWLGVIFGELPQDITTDSEAAGIISAAGTSFFQSAVCAIDLHGEDWKAFTNALRTATGCKGPDLFKPLRYCLTGVGHGPEMAPLLKLMTAARARTRLLKSAQ